MTLNDYVFSVQRILHDAQAQTWPVNPDLIKYINLGRDKVCYDTHCSRVLPIITLNPLQERYTYSYIQPAVLGLSGWLNTGGAPASRGIATIIGINCIQNTAYQPPLKKLAWSELNVQYRQQGPLNPAAFPSVWADFEDGQNFYIANVPGSPLTAEIDCCYLPVALANLTDLETAIFDPLTTLVPLVASMWAMYYQDEQDTAMTFWAHYKEYRDQMMSGLPPFSGFT